MNHPNGYSCLFTIDRQSSETFTNFTTNCVSLWGSIRATRLNRYERHSTWNHILFKQARNIYSDASFSNYERKTEKNPIRFSSSPPRMVQIQIPCRYLGLFYGIETISSVSQLFPSRTCSFTGLKVNYKLSVHCT